jgi:hypothetical protein
LEDAAFAAAAFEHVLSRSANAEELEMAVTFLVEQQQKLASVAERVVAAGGPTSDPTKPSSDPKLRAREGLVHVLLNHNDFVTIR